jgi:predicted esterase
MSRKLLVSLVFCMLGLALVQCGASRHRQTAGPLPAETEPVVVVREPARAAAGEAVRLLVALHGHDQTEDQFAELWRDGFFYEPNFILAGVRAPFRADKGYAWFPKLSEFPDIKADEFWRRAIQTADDRVMAVCESLAGCYDVDPDRIYIAGASQGAGVAAFICLRHTDVFMGLAMLAGGMDTTFGTVPAGTELADMPVFISMGEAEGPIPHARVNWTRSALSRVGADVQLFTHPEGHVITQPVIRAMQNHLGLSYSFAPEVQQIEMSPGHYEDEGSEEPGSDEELDPTGE